MEKVALIKTIVAGVILCGAWAGLCLMPRNLWFCKKFPFVKRLPEVVWQRDYSPEFIQKMLESEKWEEGTALARDGLRYPVLIEVLK
jgi:hypothetical protein